MELFEILKELTAAHGPSGNEESIREVIRNMVRPLADEVSVDVMGNLIAHKKGSGPKVMFSAHMDSVGLVVTHIEKEGFLRVGRIGYIPPEAVIATPVRFKNGVCGVLAKEEKAELAKLKLDECYIDIGAKDADEAKGMVQVGDTAVYATSTTKIGCKVFSPYLDDRIACAVLLQVMERLESWSNDLYFVFSVQEEVGTRGAKTASYTIAPDYGLAVDVTDVDDTPGSSKSGTVHLGGGAAIKVMDRSVISHPEVVDHLERVAKVLELETQRDILRAGGTDAGVIQLSRGGVLTGGVSIPCRYVHSPQEMADLNDAESCVKLLAGFARSELRRL